MRARGAELPAVARATVVSAALAAALCAAPALEGHKETEWAVLLPLAALYAVCEYAPRCPLMGRRAPGGAAALRPVFFPVLLAAACLLPPSAAALGALPGALAGRVEPRHASTRRMWQASRLALALFAASHVYGLLGGSVRQAVFPLALVPAVAAALAMCAVLGALDGWILVAAERCSPRTAWRGQFARQAGPHLVHGVTGLMMAVLWRSAYGPIAALFLLLPMCICSWIFAQYHRERTAHQATIRALAHAVDIKDRYTRGHGERVGRASVLIARELGMDEERTETLRFAGILHDLGKLGVPTRLLRKDGPLTPQERRVIELHPEYGHEIVRGIGFLGEARAAILHHHERMDGSGYPYGLVGGQIPEAARVVAVADAFDAMTSTRSYRRGRPVSAALEELERCAGSQFDPRMVAALVRALRRHEWPAAVSADLSHIPAAYNVPLEALDPQTPGPQARPSPSGSVSAV
ncbi:HD-GYP domain-containing protein [Streptomyces sp. NBC_01795]|uniref:HD-GYP domain-containing protein n=1 Tax=Streptomyces sp. NBC_01795 TaxID=2975943 RepID=UPI002DD90EC2|nr:HD-GYP domain-containing protein [Streptomyces sp. NBC_01795]WSA92464.1 HD-GYP domain-containing protein [Streptomyces sp. NBC_01795]